MTEERKEVGSLADRAYALMLQNGQNDARVIEVRRLLRDLIDNPWPNKPQS